MFQCVSGRFRFFDGEKTFTVGYYYGIQMWYVFKDDDTTNSLFSKKINPRKSKSPNRDEADLILIEYLASLK